MNLRSSFRPSEFAIALTFLSAASLLIASESRAYSAYGRAGQATASPDVWLVTANALANFDYQPGSAGSTMTVGVSLGVGHSLGSSFEGIGFGTFYLMNAAGQPSNQVIEFSAQCNWVIVGGHADALYLGARFGYDANVNLGVSSSYLLFGGILGKRVGLGGSVSYDPNLSATWFNTSAGIGGPDYRIVPLQFTLVF